MGPWVSLDLLECQHVDGTWIGALKLHQEGCGYVWVESFLGVQFRSSGQVEKFFELGSPEYIFIPDTQAFSPLASQGSQPECSRVVMSSSACVWS